MLFCWKANAVKSPRLLLAIIFCLAAFALHRPADGQVAAAKEPVVTEQANAASVAPESQPPAPTEITLEAVEKLRRQATEAAPLADATRAEIIDLCDKAIERLKETRQLSAATALLQKEIDEAGVAQQNLQSKPPEAEPEPLPTVALSADELRTRLSDADQRVNTARDSAQKVAAEIQRRAERRKALPEAIAKCREQLDKAGETLKVAVKEEIPLLAEAQRLYQACRRDFLATQLKSLEQETRTYEATSRLWLARRDAAEKQLQTAIDAHKAIHVLASDAQRHEAERQAREARRVAVNAHPAVKEAAAQNAELAERNKELVSRTQQVQLNLGEVRELGQIMRNRLEDVVKRAEALKNAPAIGVMLRSQQDQLPALGPYRERLRTRPIEISQLGLNIYEWESLRREALHIDQAVESTVGQIDPHETAVTREDIAAELRRVLEARANILAELISNANDCVSRLEQLDAAATALVSTTEQLESFIAEHVLWVRSAPTLSLEEFRYARTFWTDLESRKAQAKELAAALIADARSRPAWWGLAALLVAIMVAGLGWAKDLLKTSGDSAAKPTATRFFPTVEASLATIWLALTVPIPLGFVGWRLCQADGGVPNAAGWALTLFAAAFAMLNLVRHASRRCGLGTHHFAWDKEALTDIRRAAKSIQLLALPLLAVAVAVEISRDEESINSLGRLSLITALIVTGVVCFRLFRPSGALAAALATAAGGSLGARAASILSPVATLAMLGLIAASAAGYHYAAMQLTRRVFVSCVFVFACLALRSLLMRWLLVTYRRVAMLHARERRQAKIEAQENASPDIPVVETLPQVNLSDINQQARNLVGAGAGLAFAATLWFLWGDMLPALSIFSRVQLWASGIAPSNPDGTAAFVTLTDLFVTITIFAFTWFAGRNLPGLLEIAVLQKLPLDPGARYAASSVTRYAIMVGGGALGLRQLGVGWQSVQWLIAAMTVGLGFGLQEIFANFVSGMILLFERPARVGDTVTIGEITGTITKIRIRATTILDWDNRELIVPNKEFVTGNLVNWTLSNPNLRLVIKVGVAYGSDTRLATALLYKVAADNPQVLESPEPVVVFHEFGESSLNFELRLFVSDLTMYRRLRHDLHLAIDDSFRRNNIEIAFPQCDLHIKELPRAAMGDSTLPQSAEAQRAKFGSVIHLMSIAAKARQLPRRPTMVAIPALVAVNLSGVGRSGHDRIRFDFDERFAVDQSGDFDDCRRRPDFAE